ncbi:alpha-L-glutamate ligase [Streptomyces piniterrae]|uniref:Alpha-L-glutamate ligase n=1 Tax=Streptomyces piniterrae TaxID=2571125 RepID=A0A4U0N6U9_9ACTN|nr:alpha-L-glutamate ligase [Streptomyces piniterrae]TJZ49519.1 alpha-L-glutamate ligase [Streptomyces piniterrae]
MRICLITAAPDHPLLAAATDILTPRHQVTSIDPGEGAAAGRPAADLAGPEALADVYLLKARTPRALALAASLEERGAPVLNSAAATALCQDRTEMAALALRAGLPFAATRTVATLTRLAAERPAVPLVIKSRHSRRHDLVARADDTARIRELATVWPDEPVVVQEFTPNSGWDHKLWAVEGRLFAALRRSELTPEGRGPTLPLPVRDLPPGWADLVRRVGEVFALDVYGVDLIDAGDGAPLIVDINAFPGIRGQAGAPEALAELAVRVAAGKRGPRALVAFNPPGVPSGSR